MSSSVGFVVGFIMFGAIIFIPLYLQTVHGATPTSAGLQLLPMVGGMLITFILSGRLISRWGRYKVFPVFGTGHHRRRPLSAVAPVPTTSLAVSSFYMFVVGFGLGPVMQVLVVAVQNAVPYSQLGTATSSATFFRSIGGVVGIALFGAIFNSRLLAELPKYLPASALRHLRGDPSPSTRRRSTLSPGHRHGYVRGLQPRHPRRLPHRRPLHGGRLRPEPGCLKEVPLRTQSFVSVDDVSVEDVSPTA